VETRRRYTMNQVATYSFSGWLSTRTFVLFSDRVVIKRAARFPVCVQESQPIPLRCLYPASFRSEWRPPGYVIGISVCLGGFALITAWLLCRGFELPGYGAWVIPLIMVVISLAGLGCALCSTRRWQFEKFYLEAEQPAFTIECPPGDRAAFEGFVNAVTIQMKSVNQAK
jgi:hypothetical protein